MGFYDNHRHYIYTLLHNESVVYVGVSSDVKHRYKEHHYDSNSNVFYFGRYLLSLQTPLRARIIDDAPNKTAGHKLEMLYIANYSTKYHLFNYEENYLAINSIIPRYSRIINSHLLAEPMDLIEKMQIKWQHK